MTNPLFLHTRDGSGQVKKSWLLPIWFRPQSLLSNDFQETTSVTCPYSIPQTCPLRINFTRSYPCLYVVAVTTNGNATNKVPFLVEPSANEQTLLFCQFTLVWLISDAMFDHGFIRYRILQNTCQSHSRVKLYQTLWILAQDQFEIACWRQPV